ncbi:MAG TPA: PAS domain-containing protein [Opitutaceae bacterium]
MVKPFNLLLVEDNPPDAELVLRQLRRSGFEPTWTRVDTEQAYLAELAKGPDLILSDYDMPQFSGLRALMLLKEQGLDIPLIIVSGTIGEETAVAAMREGAADYLMKDRLVRLGQAVTSALEQSALRRERRHALEALAESEERFQELAANINEVFWLTDVAKNQMLYVSPAYAVIWGRSCASLIASPHDWIDAIHPDDRARVREAVGTKQAQGSYDEEFRILRPDGELRWIRDRAFPVRNASGEVYRIVGVSTDITPRRRAEEAQRASEERLQILIENTSDIIALIDDQGVIQFHGPSVERILGIPVVELVGRSAMDFVHEEDQPRLREAISRAILKPDQPFTVEMRVQRKDGVWRSLQTIGKFAGNLNGSSVIVVNSRDVTDQRLLEQQFLRAQRMEAIGSLANGVAHDLNNILSPVMIASGLLKESSISAQDRHLVDMVEQAARRGADIIRQLLTFSRGVEGARMPIQLRHIVKEMVALMRETFPREITIEKDVPADLPVVRGDATQIHQVLMNLCVNARDAMPDGGKLVIRSALVEIGEAEASRQTGIVAGPFVQLTVSDTGSGIPAAIRDRIFDPFFTTKEQGKGTGLGLSTVLGIVRSHQGFITIASEPGQGSAFSVHLPLDRGDAVPFEPERPGPVNRGQGRHILFVDDEEAIRMTVRLSLELQEYEVTTAANGVEAFAFLDSAAADDVVLVITDIMMPGMNGTELIRRLRLRRPWLPVLAISGQTDDLARSELGTMGILSIVMKPFVPSQLLRAIDDLLAPRH